MESFSTKYNLVENGRLDPKYYRTVRLKYFDKLKSNKNIVKLKDIILEGNYGILPPGDCYNVKHPVKLIRATDLKPDLKIDFHNALKVPIEYFKKRVSLKENDILIAVKGATIASNKCIALVKNKPKNTIFNGSIFRFQLKKNVNPKYVAYILNTNIIKNQMKYNLVANNAVDYLNKSLIEGLFLPFPKDSIQQKIINLMENAYLQKRKNEEETHGLLTNIDKILLEGLNLNLPEIRTSNYYTVNSSKIKNRIDPYYYQPDFSKFIQVFIGSENVFKSLGNIINGIVNGFDYRKFSDKGTPYLRVSNIKPFKIDRTDVAFVDLNAEDISKAIQLKKGDILLTRKGTFGNAVSIESDLDDIISSEIFKIDLKKSVNPFFLSAVLNSPIGQIQFDRLKIGAIMGSLSQDSVKSVLIPVPSMNKQRNISYAIQDCLKKANELKSESIDIIEHAKKKVEKILFEYL
jgi:restriction endonuclease S subunit